MIEFREVDKHYPDGTVAVSRLSLVAETGKVTVFVGPSGCGKTTSLRMINRMVEPSGGTVLVNGADVMAQDPAELRRGIGYVIQQAGLFPHRTVVDNVATVPLLLGWSRKRARDRAAELMELVGLAPELAKRYPAQLSGGQQQRVGVARALAADPPVLLMDEPFSAVDPVVRESLRDELLRLQDDLGKTVVFVTHDIDEAVKLGDKVAVFRVGGVLAQYDSPGALLARPADDFVDNFVGRDRGYRGLGFRSAAGLPIGELTVLTLGTSLRQARALIGEGWAVVVDERHRPQGWVRGADLAPGDRSGAPGAGGSADPAGEPVIGRERLVAGGSIYDTGSDSLRGALDAALSSPSGLGVAVDADGAVVGSVSAGDVLERLKAARDDEAAA